MIIDFVKQIMIYIYVYSNDTYRLHIPLYFIFRQNVIFPHYYILKHSFILCEKFHCIWSKGAHLIKFQICMDYSDYNPYGFEISPSSVLKRQNPTSRQLFFYSCNFSKYSPLHFTQSMWCLIYLLNTSLYHLSSSLFTIVQVA